jgi:hypothetical protein
MTNFSNPAVPPCLLCGSGDISARDSMGAEEVLACWSQDGQLFPPRSIQIFLDEGNIHLYECRKCGFQFFDPKLAGGAEFYEQLHAHGPEYYAPDRPEAERNARFAKEHGYHSILDVGCAGLDLPWMRPNARV